MKRTIYFLVFVGCVFIIGCDSDSEEFDGSDNIITVSRDFSEFVKIDAEDDLDVNIMQGNKQKVEIMVNDNLQEQLLTRVDDNTLFVGLANGSYSNETFVVNIELLNLESIRLEDNTRGVADVSTDVLGLDVNDSAELMLSGSSETLNLNINDAGLLNGFSFTTNILNTTSTDASEVEITCNSELNGSVNDASELRYKGMPVVNAITSDNGKIIDAN